MKSKNLVVRHLKKGKSDKLRPKEIYFYFPASGCVRVLVVMWQSYVTFDVYKNYSSDIKNILL